MEFLQIHPDTHVYEGELEQVLIDHLQHFLLELGRGVSFVARQKRFTLDGQDFFIDMVFYNYILKCFVLIDLKMGKLTHQDLGQMQMYVNYYTREMMNEGDSQPIGIVLCADKGDSIVKYTLPEDNHQIFASKYFTYLPSEEELKRELNLDSFYSWKNQMGTNNKVCPGCGRKMKQQFIGLQHCKCTISWKKDIGFFERTSDMIFALEHRTIGKKVKQIPVIRYKNGE